MSKGQRSRHSLESCCCDILLCLDTKYIFLNQPYFITIFCVLNSHDVADSQNILRIPNELQIIPWDNPTGDV